MNDGSIRKDDGDAKQVVSNRSMRKPARPAGILVDEFADGQAFGVRRVKREPLAVALQLGLQRGQGYAGLDGDGHVFRRVLEDAVEGTPIHAFYFLIFCERGGKG